MPILDRALTLFGLQRASTPETAPESASDSNQAPAPKTEPDPPLREAAGKTVDADDASWRRLTGRSDKDLQPLTHARMLRLAQHLWESNPLGNRLIELPLAYLLAKGVHVAIADEKDQKTLDRHWRDSINAWDIKLVKRVRELSMFGDTCWPVFLGGNGFVRVGYLDPKRIETVVMDPENAEQPIGIVTTKVQGRAQRYRVIVNGPESIFAPRTREIRQTFTDGNCFYFRVNDLCNGTRGRSDLLAQMDWIDAYDEFLFGELDRADFMRAFVWDVKITGADQTAIDERAKKIAAPAPGSVRVHNENEEWNAVQPELQAGDGSTAARLFRNHILGGNTMPEHWFGGGGDVNRSTAGSMAEPTEKTYEMRQTYIGHMLTEVATFVLRASWDVLDSEEELSEDQQQKLDSLKVEWPEMSAKDNSRYASAFQQIASAGAQAIQDGLLQRKTVVAMLSVFARQLGVDFDVEEELEAALQELAERRAQDGFNDQGDPNPDDDADPKLPGQREPADAVEA